MRVIQIAVAGAAGPAITYLATLKEPALLAAQANQKTGAGKGNGGRSLRQRRRTKGDAQLKAGVNRLFVGQVVEFHERQHGAVKFLGQLRQCIPRLDRVVVEASSLGTDRRRLHRFGIDRRWQNEFLPHVELIRVADAVGVHQLQQRDALRFGNQAQAIARFYRIKLRRLDDA